MKIGRLASAAVTTLAASAATAAMHGQVSPIALSLAPPASTAAMPDLLVAIHQDTPNPVVTLTQTTYTVTVSTVLPAKLNNVEVEISLDGQWTAPPGGPGAGCLVDASHPPLRMVVRCSTSVLDRPATLTVKMIPSLLIGIASPADRNIEAIVNPDRRIAESDFSNNRVVIHTQLTGLPELNFNTANEPTSAHTGQEISFSVRMQNFGDLDAHNVVVHVDLPRQLQFVRVDQSQYDSCNIGPPDAQNRRVLTCTRAVAAAGSAFGASVVTHVSNDLAQPQTALVAMSVDPDNAIREHDETNNTFGVATTIQLAPDLAVASVTVDSVDPGTAGCTTLGGIVVSGGIVNTTKVARVRVNVANVGAGNAAASSLEIDLNQALFNQSQAFGSCDVPAIAAGQSTTVTFIINTNRTGNLGHVTIDPLHFTGDFNGANQTKDIIR